MNSRWEKIEHLNSRLIPYAVFILLIVILIELFFHGVSKKYHFLIEIIDWVVVGIFVVDLAFLAKKAKSTKYFFKHYWLDILAVLPFDLLLKFTTRFYAFFVSAERVGLGQNILHESLEVSKAASEAERIAKVGRGVRTGARIVRVISKSNTIPRFKRKKIEHVRFST